MTTSVVSFGFDESCQIAPILEAPRQRRRRCRFDRSPRALDIDTTSRTCAIIERRHTSAIRSVRIDRVRGACRSYRYLSVMKVRPIHDLVSGDGNSFGMSGREECRRKGKRYDCASAATSGAAGRRDDGRRVESAEAAEGRERRGETVKFLSVSTS